MEDFNKKYKQKNPFTVPKGYFDNLTERVLERVEVQGKVQRDAQGIVKERARGNSEPFVEPYMKPYMKPSVAPSMGVVRRLKPYMAWVAVLVVAIALYPLLTPSVQQVASEEFVTLDGSDEYIFDSDFNPTAEEIIEYLAVEVEDYELIIAGLY